jgi:K+-sensing histidine kinase KdpD
LRCTLQKRPLFNFPEVLFSYFFYIIADRGLLLAKETMTMSMAGEGSEIGLMRRITPVVLSLTLMAVSTAVLWRIKLAGVDGHLIFFYLLPIALIAAFYRARVAMLCILIAMASADYFLQDPVYSFYNTNPLEYGDMICFGLLAAMAVKCTRELVRPGRKTPIAKTPLARTRKP